MAGSLQVVEDAIAHFAAMERQLEDTLRRLPIEERRVAIPECLRFGMSQSEVARALGVSRARIGQILSPEKASARAQVTYAKRTRCVGPRPV